MNNAASCNFEACFKLSYQLSKYMMYSNRPILKIMNNTMKQSAGQATTQSQKLTKSGKTLETQKKNKFLENPGLFSIFVLF